MSVIGRSLFFRPDRASVSDLALQTDGHLAKKVDAYDQRRFDAQSDDEVVETLVRETAIEALEVHFDKAENRADEITLRVHDLFGDIVQVPGLRVTKSLPFSGDADLWYLGVGQWGSSMPQGEVRGNKLVIGMEVRSNETEAAVQHINSTIGEVKEYLALQKSALEKLNLTLDQRFRPLVAARRGRRSDAQALLDRF